jgi:hypothetical protein
MMEIEYIIKLMRVISLGKVVRRLLLINFILATLLAVFTTGVFSQENSETTSKKEASSQNAILLQPSFQQLKIKEKFQVAVVVNSSLPLVGADVKISYDSRLIEVLSIDGGDAFPKFPRKSVDKGTIALTVLAEKGKEFSGTGTIAILNLTSKDGGDTNLKVAYTSGKTDDSNLTQVPAADVLNKVDTGHYIIGSPMQRNLGAIKRFLIKIIPYVLFLALLIILGYLAYRWYKSQKQAGPEVFVPEEVPLDQPPQV